MSLSFGGKEVPKACADILIQIRDRVVDLKKKYFSLSVWGRPYLFDVKEVAVIYYINKKLGVSVERIAGFLGVDKTALYNKYINRIDSEGRFSIYDPQIKKTVEVHKVPEELINIVEADVLKVSAKETIPDPLQSSIIYKFWTEPIRKRTRRPGSSPYISEKDKRNTLMWVTRLMIHLKRKGLPNNPDLWEEKTILDAINELVQSLATEEYKKIEEALKAGRVIRRRRAPDPEALRRSCMKALRRVPEWRNWFDFMIGAESSSGKKRKIALFYKQYLQLKDLWRKGTLTDAEFLTIWLHITTGAREGYTIYSSLTRLDDPSVKASLVGLRWEKLNKIGDEYILSVYERKTFRDWDCNLKWLDEEVMKYFLSKYMRSSGSIIATITGFNTVGEFRRWYIRLCKRAAELLGYTDLKPHDMRRSHISILAEFGVPMEYALSGMMDLGVGWEDAKTALDYYITFSEHTKRMVYDKIETSKEKLRGVYGVTV